MMKQLSKFLIFLLIVISFSIEGGYNETAVSNSLDSEKMTVLLEEVKTSFKIGGKYIHPSIIKEFENWISDCGLPYSVSIDINAAIDTNKFFGDVTEEQSPFCEAPMLTLSKKGERSERFYECTFVGKTEEGLCIIFSRRNEGGTLTTCTLHVIDFSLQKNFTEQTTSSKTAAEKQETIITAKPYYQLIAKSIFQCNVAFAGHITVEGNRVTIENKENAKKATITLPLLNS